MGKNKGSEILTRLGEKVKAAREKKGLSLRQLAAMCNVDHSVIAKIEKGDRNISISTLFDLAGGLELHAKKLIDFEID